MWVRLLGKGVTQGRAIEEILSYPGDDPRREVALQLLITWKISMEINQVVEEEEEEAIMVLLSRAYVEWEQRTKQEGERSMICRLLSRRLGVLPIALVSQIETLSTEQLENLGEALSGFSGVADLQTWLDECLDC